MGTTPDNDQRNALVGGWEIIPSEAEELPADAQAAFDQVFEGLEGEYTPVKLLAKQLVSGTNYCILCQTRPADSNSTATWSLVYIYVDLQGNADLLNVCDLYIDAHSMPEE